MIKETQEIIHHDLDFLPLKSYSNIHEGNALQLDWQNICSQPNFIIGNPPFVGKSFQTPAQKADLAKTFKSVKGRGNLDYVTCWFKRAVDFIGTKTECAFVATNSICQGIAVPPLWKYLFSKGVVVNFAYQTFKWQSESFDLAAVHCVIVGFAKFSKTVKKIFNGESCRVVDNINTYLRDCPNIIVEPQAKPLNKDALPMFVGSCPTDGGHFLLTVEEYADFIKREPTALKWIRQYMGSNEFINGIVRYCLWLKGCPPNELRKMPRVMKRVEGVKDFRLASKKAQTCRRAEIPMLFAEDRFVDAPALFMPMVSLKSKLAAVE